MEQINVTHLKLPFLKAETTLFKSPISNTIPDEQITMGQVLLGILKGRWQKEVKNVRELKIQYLNSGKAENKIKWNRAKEKLPYFTVSVSCEGGRDLRSVKGMTQLIAAMVAAIALASRAQVCCSPSDSRLMVTSPDSKSRGPTTRA